MATLSLLHFRLMHVKLPFPYPRLPTKSPTLLKICSAHAIGILIVRVISCVLLIIILLLVSCLVDFSAHHPCLVKDRCLDLKVYMTYQLQIESYTQMCAML